MFASLAMAAGLMASPATAQEVTLRVATAATSKTIWQQEFDKFAADVAEETNGNVKIEIFNKSHLGPGNTVLPQVNHTMTPYAETLEELTLPV